MKPLTTALAAAFFTFLVYFRLFHRDVDVPVEASRTSDVDTSETSSMLAPANAKATAQQQDQDGNPHQDNGEDSNEAVMLPKMAENPEHPFPASDDAHGQQQQQSQQQDQGQDDEAEKIERLRQKLQPIDVVTVNGTLAKHQFLHLHHMKTAGTSMDGLISCGKKRLLNQGYPIKYYNIHECNPSTYKRCFSGEDQKCRQRMKDATMMSYCAPLKDLAVFDWKHQTDPIHALTVLRHPVARVWSMFRFQTRRCYQCRPLKDVYASMDRLSSEAIDNNLCYAQLTNHQTRNLLTKIEGTEDEMVQQAIEDMETFFTFIGITEDIPSTAAIAGKVFPWLAEEVEGSSKKCPFPHKNASPSNNHCGPGGTHWDLPDQPDDETAELIRQHNQLDLRVYEAAVKHFELQKKALGL